MVLRFIFPSPNGPYQSYPYRQDRQLQGPTARNAQGLFPPGARLFVGNLAIGINSERLARDVQEKFSSFGRCHVKIKFGRRNLPGAFVQFERVEDANTVLASGEDIRLHNRCLRVEKARGIRTACFGFRDGAPVSQTDVYMAFAQQAYIEACVFEHSRNQYRPWTLICKVTFAYVETFKDAIKAFERNPIYYLIPLDVQGSPLVPSTYSYRLPPGYNTNNNNQSNTSTQHRRTKEVANQTRDNNQTRVPLPAEFQPNTGHTIEEYVREEAHNRSYDQDEHIIRDVIQDLENEQRARHLQEESSTPSLDNSSPHTPAASISLAGSVLASSSTDVQVAESRPEPQPQPALQSTIDHLLSDDSSPAGLTSTSTIRSRSRSKSI